MFLCTMRNSGVVLCGGGDFFFILVFILGWGFFLGVVVCVCLCSFFFFLWETLLKMVYIKGELSLLATLMIALSSLAVQLPSGHSVCSVT